MNDRFVRVAAITAIGVNGSSWHKVRAQLGPFEGTQSSG
jgi:hypothetical protein